MSPRDVVIEGATRTYNRADRENPNSDLHFCATCGCTTHWSASAGLIERMGGEVELMAVNRRLLPQIGRATCRERWGHYVEVLGVARTFKKKNKNVKKNT